MSDSSNPGQAAAAPNRSLTLSRGLLILDVLTAHPDGLTVAELAAELDTHRAGVYRLLGSLTQRRLVARTEDGRHVLGLGLIELASHVRTHLIEHARPEMQRLADRVGATTGLTLKDGDHAAVVAAVVEPRGADVHLAYRPGLRHELDRVASGMAILAAGPRVEGEREEITLARERGWAYSEGELLRGTVGIAAPIVPSTGEVEAALSAVWIADRDVDEVARLLMGAAAAIAAAIR